MIRWYTIPARDFDSISGGTSGAVEIQYALKPEAWKIMLPDCSTLQSSWLDRRVKCDRQSLRMAVNLLHRRPNVRAEG